MKKLILFGAGDIAELAYYYFCNDSDYMVEAFVVDEEYKLQSSFCGLPLISFSNLTENYPPEDYHFFVAISYANRNTNREEKYKQIKLLGYEFASYISSRATVLSDEIGENCFILEDNTVQPFVKIGNNVTLWSGNHIGHHSTIESHCFISSHVVISGGVTIGHNSFIGVNSTLRDHINIGSYNVIGAGSIIMSSTETEAVFVPARTVQRTIKSSELKGF